MLRLESAYKRGMQCVNAEQYLEAIQYFKQSIKENKEVAKSHQACARAYFYLKQYEDAEDACSEVLQLDEKLIKNIKDEIYLRLGRIYLNQGRFEEAFQCITRASKLCMGKSQRNRSELALCYLYRGKANSALMRVESAILDFEISAKLYAADSMLFKLLSAEYAKNNDQFNAYRCLISALHADISAKGKLTRELDVEYCRRLVPFKAVEILAIIRSMPINNALAMLKESEKNVSPIKKYYPAESIQRDFYAALGENYILIAEKYGLSEDLNVEIIKMLLKVMLAEMRLGKNTSDHIERAANYLMKISPEQIFDIIDEYFTQNDAIFLLQQYQSKLFHISKFMTSEYVETIEKVITSLNNEINYRSYMQQPDSIRLTSYGLNILFAPTSARKESSFSLADNDSLISKSKTV